MLLMWAWLAWPLTCPSELSDSLLSW